MVVLPAVILVFLSSSISFAHGGKRNLCIAGPVVGFTFSHAEDMQQIRHCNIIYGNVGIAAADFTANFTPLSNLTELVGKLSMFANEGPISLGHIFPNLAVIRFPHPSTPSSPKAVQSSIYLSETTNFKQINLTKLAYNEGNLEITTETLCYANTVYWNAIASSVTVGDAIQGSMARYTNSFESCWDTCPLECPTWPNGAQYCWSSTECQYECKCTVNLPGFQPEIQRGYCRSDNHSQCCDPSCLGGCNGPTASNCTSCRNLMILDTGACLMPNVTTCPKNYFELKGKYCVSVDFCRKLTVYANKYFKIYNGKCLAECPTETNDDPKDRYKCVPCSEEFCRRIDVNNRTVMYASDFPSEKYTDINGNLVLNLEGMPILAMKPQMEMFSSLRNITGALKIYRSERIQDLDIFGSLQEIGTSGCSVGNGVCLTIVRNEFLQRLWTPKNGKLRVNGNVSISYNPRLCQSEVEKLKRHLKFTSPNFGIVHEGNGDRGYCSAMPIKPIQVISQFADRNMEKSNDAHRSLWAIVPMVAFNLSNTDQLLTLFVYHQSIESERINLTYYDPAYCEASGSKDESTPSWKRHVVNVANYSNPDVWRIVNGQKLFVTNVTSPFRLDPEFVKFCKSLDEFDQKFLSSSKYHAIYALAQYLDGKIAMSEIIKFKTIPATPAWGVGQTARADGRSYNFITLQWKEPSFPNGNVTHYLIRFWKEDTGSSIPTHNNCLVQYRPTTLTTPRPGTTTSLDVIESDSGMDTMERMRNIHDIIIATITKSPHHVSEEANRQSPLVVDGLDGSSGGNSMKSGAPERLAKRSVPEKPPSDKLKVDCSKLAIFLKTNDLINRVIDVKNNHESDTFVVCETTIHISNLEHFTNYKFEIRACHDPNLTASNPYLCSTTNSLAMRTEFHPDADRITLDMIQAAPNTDTIDGRVYRRIYVQRPNLTNGAVMAFQLRFRGLDAPDWIHRCAEYTDNGLPMEFLLPVLDPKYVLQVRVITANANTALSPEFYFDGVVSDVPFIMSLSIGTSAVLLLVSAGLMTWYAFVLRKKKRLMKARGAGTPDWISMNPDYPLLSAVDIPAHLELDREDIEVLAEVGHGSFGVVYRGILKQAASSGGNRSRCQVAIKSLRCDATLRQRHDFLHEALLMAGLDCHHVVRMVGVVSKTQPVYVVMELMENGDLKAFLVKQRTENVGGSGPNLPSAGSSAAKLALPGYLTVLDFTQMAGEIADGMAYLSARKIVHRDLAARNCLVARDRTVKIGDFGLARDVYDDGYYHLNGRGLLPIRWMAPESLKDGVFDTNSDVWAYGVLLWEIVTYGEQPYQGKSNEEVLEAVKQHRQVLNKPKNCPDKFYNLMLRCWQYKPNERPSFVDIVRELLPALRPDFLKLSFYGTLSAAEIAPSINGGFSHNGGLAHNGGLKVATEQLRDEDSEANSLADTNNDGVNEDKRGSLKCLSPNDNTKAVANLYNVVNSNHDSAVKQRRANFIENGTVDKNKSIENGGAV